MRIVVLAFVAVTTIAVHAQSSGLQRGDLVRVHTADGMPASPELQVVVALPGDRLRVDASGIYVNDEAVHWMSAELKRAFPRDQEVIQPGQVLVAGEERHTVMTKGGSTTTSMGHSWNNIPLTRVTKADP